MYSYKHGFSGFAAVLTESQAKLIAGVTMLVNCELCFLIKLELCKQVLVVDIVAFHDTTQTSQELLVLYQTEFLVCRQLEVGIFSK